ncbi:MAG: VOC family protein [Desulfomonile sp.]|nr:VOC family protein [Desulfomonile sp.]
MRLPSGHVRRLFLGFTCSIMFLVVLAILIAYNTDAESSAHSGAVIKERTLPIAIATSKPEETIDFYKKLGFKTSLGLSGELDMVCLEKEGTPYKLEICHTKSIDAGIGSGGVSGLSFRVTDLSTQIQELKAKGFTLSVTRFGTDGISYASLTDPNGINIKLFER